MMKKGFKLRQYKKGVYMDGHERPDVVAYQQKYIETLQGYDS